MLKKLLLSLFKIVLLSYILLISFAWGLSDSLIFLPPPAGYTKSDHLLYIQSKTYGGDSTHAIVADYTINPSAKYTVIYNHGNAVDLSGLQNLKQKFYNHNYSIIMYDYSGYGLSDGKPSEQQVYNDSQAIYNFLINEQSLRPNQIIIYGHSLGSGVATNLALNNPAASLILESAFTSAFRVKTLYPIVPFDKFSSIKKLPGIHIPLLLMHGYDDHIIPISHSKSLFKIANQPKHAIWFEHAGHNNITKQGDLFWRSLDAFIKTI